MHVMAQLGSGSFGEVYTALWKSSKGEVKVAVKYFNSKLIGKDSNFDREVCDKKNISLSLLSLSNCISPTVALGTVSTSHYVIRFGVGDVGLGVGFGNAQFNGDLGVTSRDINTLSSATLSPI